MLLHWRKLTFPFPINQMPTTSHLGLGLCAFCLSSILALCFWDRISLCRTGWHWTLCWSGWPQSYSNFSAQSLMWQNYCCEPPSQVPIYFLKHHWESTDLLRMRSYSLISIMLYMKTDTFTVLIYQGIKDNESVMCCHITYFINYRYIFQKKVILLGKRCIVLHFP